MPNLECAKMSFSVNFVNLIQLIQSITHYIVYFQIVELTTGCLKKRGPFVKNAITPSFIEETFPNFV